MLSSMYTKGNNFHDFLLILWRAKDFQKRIFSERNDLHVEEQILQELTPIEKEEKGVGGKEMEELLRLNVYSFMIS